MKFDTEKKGYDKRQVDKYIFKLNENFNNTLAEQKEIAIHLKEQNELLNEKLAEFERSKNQIAEAVIEAQKEAAKLKRKAQNRFAEEMARLSEFRSKWTLYVKNAMAKAAPQELEKAREISGKLSKIMLIYGDEAKEEKPIDKVQALLEQDSAFAEVAAADACDELCGEITQEEILDVKQSLEELCKDLGIID